MFGLGPGLSGRERAIRTAVSALCLAALFCAVPASYGLGAKKQSESENMAIRDKWALTIGINRFCDQKIPALKLAQKSSADLARALKDADSGHFALDHVLVLNGAGATKAGIEQGLNDWLYKKALPDDFVVIYLNSRVMKGKDGRAYVCASDTQLTDPENTGIDLLSLLKNTRQRVGSSHILCLLDLSSLNPDAQALPQNQAQPGLEKASEQAKTPGPDKAAPGPDKEIKALARASGITILSASELFGNSNDDNTSLQTFFVHYFVEALKTGGGNYPLAMTAEYVWQKVKESTAALGPAQQSPVLGPAVDEDQTLAVPLGIMVRSSLGQKSIAIGHSMDDLAMKRPDIIPPAAGSNRSTVKLNPRNSAPLVTAAKPAAVGAGNPNASVSKPSPSTSLQNPPGKSAADEDDDDFDPTLDMRPYVANMKKLIQKNWTPPKGFESRKVGTIFSILRDGTIANPEITDSSGNEEMDKSALEALKASSPLEPLPKGAPRSVDIKYAFDWKTTIETKR